MSATVVTSGGPVGGGSVDGVHDWEGGSVEVKDGCGSPFWRILSNLVRAAFGGVA